MRVAYLAAGAGGMYCGSCMRDNRLAATLIAQRRDVVLIPLYTPLRTDEVDVSRDAIYYGGINVYLQQVFPPFRYLPQALDRFLNSPRLLHRIGRMAGGTRPSTLGRLTVSVLKGEEGAQRKELSRLIAGLRTLRPDLINLPNLMFVGTARRLKDALGTAVICTLGGEDVFLDQLSKPYRGEAFTLIRNRARDIDGYISTTEYYADHAAEHFGLPRRRIHVVPMGIKVDDFAETGQTLAKPFTIGYLARVCHEKGLASLCQAFVALRRDRRSCRLRVAGYLAAADRPYLEKIRRYLTKQGVDDAVDYIGEVSRTDKARFLRSLHALCVPTVFPEAKGFYCVEAMASGVPIVQPRLGSFPEIIDATGGGLLYDPGETRSLINALAKLMDDETLRQRLGRQGREAVRRLFTDEVMAERTWAVYRRYGGKEV